MIFAPRAVRQSAVASMSLFVSAHGKSVGVSEKAAQISSLWAWDFDGITVKSPRSRRGLMVISIITDLPE